MTHELKMKPMSGFRVPSAIEGCGLKVFLRRLVASGRDYHARSLASGYRLEVRNLDPAFFPKLSVQVLDHESLFSIPSSCLSDITHLQVMDILIEALGRKDLRPEDTFTRSSISQIIPYLVSKLPAEKRGSASLCVDDFLSIADDQKHAVAAAWEALGLSFSPTDRFLHVTAVDAEMARDFYRRRTCASDLTAAIPTDAGYTVVVSSTHSSGISSFTHDIGRAFASCEQMVSDMISPHGFAFFMWETLQTSCAGVFAPFESLNRCGRGVGFTESLGESLAAALGFLGICEKAPGLAQGDAIAAFSARISASRAEKKLPLSIMDTYLDLVASFGDVRALLRHPTDTECFLEASARKKLTSLWGDQMQASGGSRCTERLFTAFAAAAEIKRRFDIIPESMCELVVGNRGVVSSSSRRGGRAKTAALARLALTDPGTDDANTKCNAFLGSDSTRQGDDSKSAWAAVTVLFEAGGSQDAATTIQWSQKTYGHRVIRVGSHAASADVFYAPVDRVSFARTNDAVRTTVSAKMKAIFCTRKMEIKAVPITDGLCFPVGVEVFGTSGEKSSSTVCRVRTGLTRVRVVARNDQGVSTLKEEHPFQPAGLEYGYSCVESSTSRTKRHKNKNKGEDRRGR